MLERTTLEEGVRRREGDEYSEAVGVALWLAFQSALERIEERSPRREAVARVQLGVLSVLAATGVPAHWLGAGDGGPDDAREALSELIESSVCQLSQDDSKVMIHGLQSRAIREVRRAEPANWEWVEDAAARLLGAVDVTAIPVRDSAGRRRETLDLVEQLRATAGQAHSKGLFSRPRTADALARALWHAAELGDPQAALSLSDAVNLLDKTLGTAHPSTLAARNSLAHAYRSAGRLDQAIDLFEQNLDDIKRVLGPDHPRTLTSRDNLAYAYLSAGRLDEAIDLHGRTLADRERLLEPDHPDILISRNNLALAYQDAGRLDEAIDLHKRTLADSERILGPDHPDILISRNNLAGAYESVGRRDEAVDLHEQNLTEALRVLGPDHPHTLISRGNLADAYLSVGRRDEAIGPFERNLAEALRILGPDHPDTKTFRNNLADAYRAVGRDEDAEALLDPPPDPDDTDAEAPA